LITFPSPQARHARVRRSAPEGHQICHGPGKNPDGSACDWLDNLSYGTHAKNNGPAKVRDGTALRGERNHKSKVTDAQRIGIKLGVLQPDPQVPRVTHRELAKHLGVSARAIGKIRKQEA
jgi:hypothetical protein